MWTLVLALAVGFVAKYVFHYYLNYSPTGFDVYWPRRAGLLVHISAGAIALLLGPWQLWTGFRARYPRIHRWTGRLFLLSMAAGACGSLYLAATTTLGWAYGLGLGGLAMAWVGTSSTAYYAILKGAVAVHRRWMIRAYVVTFGFVTYRLLDEWLPFSRLKPDNDRIITEAWMCWVLPLFVTLIVQAILDVHRQTAETKGAL